MTRAEILQRMAPCLRSVSWADFGAITEEMRLDVEFRLGGTEILKLGELLEEEFKISIGCDDLIQIALQGASIEVLAEFIEENLGE